jgi:Family of unknown function (DUF6644)
MSLQRFCEWLANTPGSIALHESLWGYPIVESVHVLTMCLFLGMIVMLDLRLLSLTMRSVPVSQVAGRLLPWARAGFVVMVITGALLFYAIPVRAFHNIFFRIKVVLLILAGINVWVFHSTVFRSVAEWDLDPVLPKRARMAGAVSLVLWASIVVAGRMIAYNWFDCDRQPQPSIVNVLAGCDPNSPE